jgi:hypothetical protein
VSSVTTEPEIEMICLTPMIAAGYELSFGARGRLCVDAVVLALPAHASAVLCEALDADLAHELASIPHSSYAAVHLAFRAEDGDMTKRCGSP